MNEEEIKRKREEGNDGNLCGVANTCGVDENDRIVIYFGYNKLKLDFSNAELADIFGFSFCSLSTARKIKAAIDSIVDVFEKHEKYGIKITPMSKSDWEDE